MGKKQKFHVGDWVVPFIYKDEPEEGPAVARKIGSIEGDSVSGEIDDLSEWFCNIDFCRHATKEEIAQAERDLRWNEASKDFKCPQCGAPSRKDWWKK